MLDFALLISAANFPVQSCFPLQYFKYTEKKTLYKFSSPRYPKFTLTEKSEFALTDISTVYKQLQTHRASFGQHFNFSSDRAVAGLIHSTPT